MAINCCHCGKMLDLSAEQKISRNEECESCRGDIHCCEMCHFYDRSSYNECREPIAERFTDKNKANFCDLFRLRTTNSNQNSKDVILSAAEALFRKK